MLGNLIKRLLHRVSHEPTGDFSTAYALYQQDRLDEAAQACEALSGTPNADVDFLLGLIALQRDDPEAAAEAMTAALDARPQEATFHHGMAKVRVALKQYRRAIEAFEGFLARAGDGDPRSVIVCVAAAACCIELEDDEGIRSWFERARAIDGDNAAILISGLLYDASKIDDARAEIARSPRAHAYLARLRRALMIPAIYQSREEIEETRERVSHELDELLAHERPERTQNPVYDLGITPFYFAYHDRNNAALMQRVCRAMRRAWHAPQAEDAGRHRSAHLRIGFVSRYFYLHSVARALALGLIRDLPRDRFTVDVFAIAPRDDAMRTAIERAADRYVRLPADLETVRRAIAAARLDVLVFTDIGMDPFTYFLALSRLAPTQIATWGHSETSGIDTIDWYLSADGVEIPEAQSHYSERLLRPKAFFLGGYQRPVLAERPSRGALGLPANRRLYACIQPEFKLHPDLDALFGGILDRDPEAEILLLQPKPGAAALLKERFARTLAQHAARLRFLPTTTPQRFLGTLACADVALDPLYFGGCNSSVETLSLGVPLVTLPGAHLYGRFTLGLYEELGVRDCIATTAADYVEKAVRLATDRDYRDAVSTSLRERSYLMFDRADITLAFARCLADELLT